MLAEVFNIKKWCYTVELCRFNLNLILKTKKA